MIGVNKSLESVRDWLGDYMGKEIQIGSAVGKLNTFIIEPYLMHDLKEEFYTCIYATRQGNTVLFHPEGGVEVGDIDTKAHSVNVDIESTLTIEQAKEIVATAPENTQQ